MINTRLGTIICLLIGIGFSAVQYGSIRMKSGETHDVIGFEQVSGDSMFLNIVDYRWQAGDRLDMNTGGEFNLDQPNDGSAPMQIISLYIDNISGLEIIQYKKMLKQSFNIMGAIVGGIAGMGVSTMFENSTGEDTQSLNSGITSMIPIGFAAAAGYYLLGNFTQNYWKIIIVDKELTGLTLDEKTNLIKKTLGGYNLYLK